jgi:hypothetical protein
MNREEQLERVLKDLMTAHLDAGAKTVRISIAMIPEGEMFAEDLQ